MKTKTIESCRAEWAETAKRFGWYTTPFYVQIWQTKEGFIIDSLSHKGMTKDIIVEVPSRINQILRVEQ